jgi:hypothetical protein
MSTKAIREALAILGRILPTQTSPEVAGSALGRALREVEAIERIANDYCGKSKETLPVREYIAVMESIAKDAP